MDLTSNADFLRCLYRENLYFTFREGANASLRIFEISAVQINWMIC